MPGAQRAKVEEWWELSTSTGFEDQSGSLTVARTCARSDPCGADGMSERLRRVADRDSTGRQHERSDPPGRFALMHLRSSGLLLRKLPALPQVVLA